MKKFLVISTIILLVTNSYGQTNFFPENGSVGIGTLSPQSNIHVKSSDGIADFPSLTSRGDILQLFEVVNNSFEIGVGGASNTRRSWILSRHSDISGSYGKYYSTLHLQPDVGDNSQFRGLAIGYTPSTHVDVGTHLAVNGNVGIGTVSPNYQLHLKDGNGLRIQASNAQLVFSDISNSLKLRMNNSGDLQLTNISDNSLFHFDNNGNIGIGTNTPTEILSLYKYNDNVKIRLQNSVTSWYLTNDVNKRFIISGQTSGNVLIINDNNGSVGIGTIETGTHKLAVDGTIGAREIKVEAGAWSDFVFDKDYKLKNLEEVERFIEENNHLPDVPSEKEVLENGIQVGEMNATLLQKIEELTLYMIEQNKKTETLIEKVETLESENELLKKEINTMKTQ